MTDPGTASALLLLDVQRGLVDLVDPERVAVDSMRRAASAARQHDIPVIRVGLVFRTTHCDVSPRNRAFRAVAASGVFDHGADTSLPDPALPHEPGDIEVTKRRVSAFAGSDLAVVLRSLSIDEVVLAGLTTSGVVLSTFREAADLDLGVVVLRDACTDPHTQLHDLLMNDLFPSQGLVLNVSEWVAGLAAPAP